MIKKLEYDMMCREKSLFINIYTFQLDFQLNKKNQNAIFCIKEYK